MAVKLFHILILFGAIAFTSQSSIDWEEKLSKDSKDLAKLQVLLSKLSTKDKLHRKEHLSPKKHISPKHRERDDIKHLLDDLEREIKKNYQNKPAPMLEENDSDNSEATGDSNSNDSDESEEPMLQPKPKKQPNQYSDLLSLLRCNCGFEADHNQVLRCRSCQRAPVARSGHSSTLSQSEHLLSLLNKYGKKYKLSDELDAIVIDVSNLEAQVKKPKSNKNRASPLPLVEKHSGGLDMNSLQALEYLLQPQPRNPHEGHDHAPGMPSNEEELYKVSLKRKALPTPIQLTPNSQVPQKHLGPVYLTPSFFKAMMEKRYKDKAKMMLPRSKYQLYGPKNLVLFRRNSGGKPAQRFGIPFEINISGLSQKQLN